MQLRRVKNATLALALVLHRHSVKSPVGLSYHKMIVLPGVDSVNFSLYYLSEQRVSCDIHSGKFDKTINAMSLHNDCYF